MTDQTSKVLYLSADLRLREVVENPRDLHVNAVVLGAKGDKGEPGDSGVLAPAPDGVDYVGAIEALWNT